MKIRTLKLNWINKLNKLNHNICLCDKFHNRSNNISFKYQIFPFLTQCKQFQFIKSRMIKLKLKTLKYNSDHQIKIFNIVTRKVDMKMAERV